MKMDHSNQCFYMWNPLCYTHPVYFNWNTCKTSRLILASLNAFSKSRAVAWSLKNLNKKQVCDEKTEWCFLLTKTVLLSFYCYYQCQSTAVNSVWLKFIKKNVKHKNKHFYICLKTLLYLNHKPWSSTSIKAKQKQIMIL